mgnify:CR=1 FL=1
MIVGIGTDLVQVTRIRQSLKRFGDRFARRILNVDEVEGFQKSKAPEYFLAKRFAAKEAVAKALGPGMRRGVSFQSIAVSHNAAGKPTVVLSEGSADVARELGVHSWHLSLSDERDHAIAFVVAESSYPE